MPYQSSAHCILLSGVMFAAMGHVLDNLEAPHNDVVEKVAPASQPIPASIMIEGSNNIRTTICHYCLVPTTHAQVVQLTLADLLHDCSYSMVQKLQSKTICHRRVRKTIKATQQPSGDIEVFELFLQLGACTPNSAFPEYGGLAASKPIAIAVGSGHPSMSLGTNKDHEGNPTS